LTTDLLKDLNPAQRKAAEAINGPVLILAGPGSGKTRVITFRIAYLVRTIGINPHRILAVTFTNKAAREMRERLEKLLSGSVKDMTLGTFHAICAGILRRDGEAIGIGKRFGAFQALGDVSLKVQPGTVHGLLGELKSAWDSIDPSLPPPASSSQGTMEASSRQPAVTTAYRFAESPA